MNDGENAMDESTPTVAQFELEPPAPAPAPANTASPAPPRVLMQVWTSLAPLLRSGAGMLVLAIAPLFLVFIEHQHFG